LARDKRKPPTDRWEFRRVGGATGKARRRGDRRCSSRSSGR
jgi:hypothetical protein